MSPPNNSKIAVVDASILVAIAAKETGTHKAAERAFNAYSQNGWIFFAPNVVISEVLYALCQKLTASVLTQVEYELAIKSFQVYLTFVTLFANEENLILRAIEIRETYGCSRSSDSLYIALAEQLGNSNTVEILTLDKGMANHAAKNAPTVVVKSI